MRGIHFFMGEKWSPRWDLIKGVGHSSAQPQFFSVINTDFLQRKSTEFMTENPPGQGVVGRVPFRIRAFLPPVGALDCRPIERGGRVMELDERMATLETRMAVACERAGRERDSVRLIAVTKTHGPEVVRAAASCGLRCFGENRVQEAQVKIPMCPSGLEWHLIGHLQRNKVKFAVRLFSMIHSVDSIALLEEIARRAGTVMPVLLEVNVSGEGVKFGLKPEETAAAVEAANALGKIEVRGLMTVPPFTPDPESARVHFKALRELRDRVERETGTPLPELSMGMSNDFEVAIEEGATFIRVGSDLFGKR